MRRTTALILVFVYLSQNVLCCNTTDYDCQVGSVRRCIPLEWLCDNVPDCENGSDESHCRYLHECPSGTMACRDGECIAMSMKCDGTVDCSHGTDEVACGNIDLSHLRRSVNDGKEDNSLSNYISPTSECSAPKYQCENGPCIVHSAICDGEEDCPMGDDELNCTKTMNLKSLQEDGEVSVTCNSNSMRCHNGQSCVPLHWLCDGENDCSDGSDELNCDSVEEEQDVQLNGVLCGELEYRCHGSIGNCISFNQTCDGVRDCEGGDDEGSQCLECKHLNCEYKCHISGSGAQCYCPHGSQLEDGTRCVDVDECLTEGRKCQHFCDNQHGRFACRCAPGYILGRDGMRCHVEDEHSGRLFLSLGTEVRRMPLSDPQSSLDSYAVAQTVGSHGMVRSLAYMHRDDTFYLAVSRSGKEGELAISSNGQLRVLRENIIGIGQVAVDWIGQNVYFTQKFPSATPGISICKTDGFFCKQIIAGLPADEDDASKRQTYMGLATFPQRGLLFWIDSFGGRHKISYANMDGSNVRTLVANKLDYPSGLTVDAIRSEIYFGDIEKGMIEKVNLNTLERHVVLSHGVHHPFELLYFNGFLYWSDWGTQTLKTSELSEHHSTSHVIHTFHQFPYGLAVNHSMYQPLPNRDPCDLIDCPWMCVNTPDLDGKLHPHCVCPEHYISGNDTCYPMDMRRSLDEAESFVGFSLMKEMCEKDKACYNGGTCEERSINGLSSDHIICSCMAPYVGERCEYWAESLVLEDPSYSPWRTFVYLLVILALLTIAIVIGYYQRNHIMFLSGEVAKGCSSIHERSRPIVSPVMSEIRNSVNFLAQGHRSRATVTPGQFENPLFSETRPQPSEDVQPYNSVFTGSFANPTYPETSTTGSPLSSVPEVSYMNKFVH